MILCSKCKRPLIDIASSISGHKTFVCKNKKCEKFMKNQIGILGKKNE